MQKTYAAMQHAASAARRVAPILKRHLPPPNAVSILLSDGQLLAEPAVITSTTIGASAGGRLVQTLQDTTVEGDTLPRIDVIAGSSRKGTPALTHADLQALWPLCHADTLVIVQDKSWLLRDIWHYPPALLPYEHRAQYSLTLHGDGRPRRGTTAQPDFALTRQGWPLLQAPDPTMITPLRALLADVHSHYCQQPRFSLHSLHITSDSAYSPLSGRDWQALAREGGGALPVHWPDGAAILDDVVPSIYSSTYMRSDTQPEEAVFTEHTLASLSQTLALDTGVLQDMTQQTMQALDTAHAPYSGTPRAATVLFTDGQLVRGGNVQLPPVGVPSCAESLTLWQARHVHPHGHIRAIMIMVAEEDGTVQFGAKAAPCGFCRETLWLHVSPDTAVILSDGQGRYSLSHVGQLQHRHSRAISAPALPAMTVTGTSGRRYTQTGFSHPYPDCAYPATAVQSAYQHQDTIAAISLDNVQGGIGAYLRSVIAGVLGADGVITIAGERIPVRVLCPEIFL